MIKRNKKLAILSSVAILLPILAILLCWNRLDGTVIIHWGLDGQPDGVGSKYWLFMPPVLMLALHWGGTAAAIPMGQRRKSWFSGSCRCCPG